MAIGDKLIAGLVDHSLVRVDSRLNRHVCKHPRPLRSAERSSVSMTDSHAAMWVASDSVIENVGIAGGNH